MDCTVCVWKHSSICVTYGATHYRDNFFLDEELSSCVTLTRARLLKVSILSGEYLNISTQAFTCMAKDTGTIFNFYPVLRAYEYSPL